MNIMKDEHGRRFTRDFFGTPIYTGDTVAYPSSGCLETATVVDIVSEYLVKTVSPAGTKKNKQAKELVNVDTTRSVLSEKFPENFI